MPIFVTNLLVYTGTDFNQTFNLEDSDTQSAKNLQGYTGTCEMKRYESSRTKKSFNVEFPNPIGTVKISMASTITSTLKPGRYYYDLILEDQNSKVSKILEGQVLVKQSVTRD